MSDYTIVVIWVMKIFFYKEYTDELYKKDLHDPDNHDGVIFCVFLGFLDSSLGKESACNVGDPGSIPWLGRSTGEGIGYPLEYSWASLVTQLVKNPPAMWETWV